MSKNPESTAALSPIEEAQKNLDATVLRITLDNGAADAAEVVEAFRGAGLPLTDYSVAVGDQQGTAEMIASVPARDSKLALINQDRRPEDILASIQCVRDIKRIDESARRHMRLLLDNHASADSIRAEIPRIGGYVQGRHQELVKLSADQDSYEAFMAVARGVPGLIARGRAAAPFSIVEGDYPQTGAIDVHRSPDYWPNAKRYVLHVVTDTQFNNDAEALRILQSHGFRVASVSSKKKESARDVQELTVMVHEHIGTEHTLRCAIPEIQSLLGVQSADRLEDDAVSEYLQASVPYQDWKELQGVLRRYPHMGGRKRMSSDFQQVASGSRRPWRQAGLLRKFVQGNLRTRMGAAFPSHNGNPIQSEDLRWPTDDADFMNLVTNSLLERIQKLPSRAT